MKRALNLLLRTVSITRSCRSLAIAHHWIITLCIMNKSRPKFGEIHRSFIVTEDDA